MPQKKSSANPFNNNIVTVLIIGVAVLSVVSLLMIYRLNNQLSQLKQDIARLETENQALKSAGEVCVNPYPPEIVANKLKLHLYYYNRFIDQGIADYIPCMAVLPVEREIPLTDTPIDDAIDLLIKGQLTGTERAHGFDTEFPHADFKLLSSDLVEGVLTLTFTEVPGFTMGGSCRTGLLAKQISLTAKQFPEVNEVKFLPESLFQP
jgi:spore germination protein GerM